MMVSFRTRAKRVLLSAPLPFRRHALRFGWRAYERSVARRGPESLEDAVDAGPWPVPPVELRVLVSCDADQAGFLRSGREQVGFFVSLLERNGIDPSTLESVLDFGCGCGRLARWWQLADGQELHGCDYNPKLVDWCREELPFMRVERSELEPPLPYADASFDLVWALSVFTHLPEPLQRSWIAELRRVLRPGGCLIVTVSGSAYTGHLSAVERRAFAAGALITHFGEVAGTNMCAAYHPRSYVVGTLLGGFDVLDVAEPGADPSASVPTLVQDTYLCRAGKN